MSRKKAHTKFSEIFWRISISAVGIALIAIAVINLLLFFFGETATANVSKRRVGGADDSRPVNQRYEWSIDYTFRDKNGVMHDGHTTLRGSDLSVKTDNRIYYFPFAPFVSSLQSEAEPNIGQPVFILMGSFLIFVMNHKKKKPYYNSKKRSAQKPDDYDDSLETLFHQERE